MHRSAGDVPLTAPAAAAGRGSARGGGAAAAGAALAAGEEAFDDLARRKGGMALDKAVPRYLSEVPPPRPADILPRTVRLADFPRRDLPVGPRELHAAEEGLEATAIFAWGSLSARLLDVDGRSFSAARASTLAQERAGGDEPAGGCVGGTDSIWLSLRRDAALLGAFAGEQFALNVKLVSFLGLFHLRSATVLRCARDARVLAHHASKGGGALSQVRAFSYYLFRPTRWAAGEGRAEAFFAWGAAALLQWNPASNVAPAFACACGSLMRDALNLPPPLAAPPRAARAATTWDVLADRADAEGRVPIREFVRLFFAGFRAPGQAPAWAFHLAFFLRPPPGLQAPPDLQPASRLAARLPICRGLPICRSPPDLQAASRFAGRLPIRRPPPELQAASRLCRPPPRFAGRLPICRPGAFGLGFGPSRGTLHAGLDAQDQCLRNKCTRVVARLRDRGVEAVAGGTGERGSRGDAVGQPLKRARPADLKQAYPELA